MSFRLLFMCFILAIIVTCTLSQASADEKESPRIDNVHQDKLESEGGAEKKEAGGAADKEKAAQENNADQKNPLPRDSADQTNTKRKAGLQTKKNDETSKTAEEHAIEADPETLLWDEIHDHETGFLKPDILKSMHEKADKDGDGKISLKETISYVLLMRESVAKKSMHIFMEHLDADHTGKLSIQEVTKGILEFSHQEIKEEDLDKALEAAKYKAADTDGDGELDAEEAAGYFYPEVNDKVLTVVTDAIFHKKDNDRDGKLTPKEFWQATPKGFFKKITFSEQQEADFDKLDADQDGILDETELKVYESGQLHALHDTIALFKVADKNEDRLLSFDELHDAKTHLIGTRVHHSLVEWAVHHEL